MATMQDSPGKADQEIVVFREFLARSGLHVTPESVQKRHPPEPDILCIHSPDGPTAFELVELCDAAVAEALNRWQPPPVTTMWLGGPDLDKVRAKFSKPYLANTPINLLCYTRSRLAMPDSVLIPTILHDVDFSVQTTFQSVWYMGEQQTTLLYDAR